MQLTPKENYLRAMRREVPEYVPAAMLDPFGVPIAEELLTPVSAPDGPITTVYGVTYVGSADLMNGAMPKPGEILLDDILRWRDVIKNPDLSDRDWESYYTKQLEKIDRKNKVVRITGGDYFLTLVSFMGFENALISMMQEPEEVYALFDYVSKHYMEVMKQQIYWCKPEVFTLMDDDSAKLAPFFSLSMYRELVKPFHKLQCDLALENDIFIDRHDCGHCEQFIDDWMELGVRSWGPAQVCNDLAGIKKKYGNHLMLSGCWDTTGPIGSPDVDPEKLREALYTYVDTFAPGGGFVFNASVRDNVKNPIAREKQEIVKDVYWNYARNYYKTH